MDVRSVAARASGRARDGQRAREVISLELDRRKPTTPTEAFDPGLVQRKAQDRWLAIADRDVMQAQKESCLRAHDVGTQPQY